MNAANADVDPFRDGHTRGAVPPTIVFNPVPSATKPLWATISVLSVCLLAMGGSLVSIYKRSAEPVAYSANKVRLTKPDGAADLRAPRSGQSKAFTDNTSSR
jgi:hypothetical protein